MSSRHTAVVAACLIVALAFTGYSRYTQAADTADLAEKLASLDPHVLSAEQRKAAVERYTRHFDERIKAANRESSRQWQDAIKNGTKEALNSLLDNSKRGLRRSLGAFQTPEEKLEVFVTKTLPGEGFAIDNVLFTSGRGLWISANLYRPDSAAESMPGILICHAHHTPKTHEELQDMGMTWARMGCLVLVMDQLGHGERRQHPFRTAKDFPKEFRPSRQDYWFRYDNAIELDLVGESLIGWMAWDLMRGVDLLLAQPGIDPKRIALLGAVAGGGDPAAVAGALDERISVVVPFNFGGPQPETKYPLPDDAETTVNFAGSGGWESTRNIRNSINENARDSQFLPWQIVGSIAPRKLIYAHEFAWDRERDPVWKRMEIIYAQHNSKDGLDFTHGAGSVRGSSPTDTHCTHIGKVHRQRIHEALARWWNLPNGAEREYSKRVPFEELMAVTPKWLEKYSAPSLRTRLGKLADERLESSRRLGLPLRNRLAFADLTRASTGAPEAFKGETAKREIVDGITIERTKIQVDFDLTIPFLLLVPPRAAESKDGPPPIVVGVSQAGKDAFLKHRAGVIAALLAGGAAVCLPDVRGTGETRASDSRDRTSAATAYSSSEQMLGGTLVGARLRDLWIVVKFLQARSDVDAQRVALWGDSFAEPNATDVNLAVPYGVDGRPRQAEPLGGLLALLGGLYESPVCAVYASGGLTGFRSVLDSPFVYIPHDCVIPGMLAAGDLADLAAALAPRPVRLDNLMDGQNRPASAEAVRAAYQLATNRYKRLDAAEKFVLGDEKTPVAQWLLAQLHKK